MRRWKWSNIIVAIIVVAAAFFILKRIQNLPSIKDLFTAKEVVIDETPILIKDIKAIGQLVTAAASDEVVMESTLPTKGSGFVNSVNRLSPFKILPSADKHIVLIGKGKVLAGTDLTLLDSQNVKVSADTVRVRLPKAIILDVIMNPADFETFDERGKWSAEEITRIKINARQKLINRALENKLLSTADRKAKSIMEQFLFAAGYNVVEVETTN